MLGGGRGRNIEVMAKRKHPGGRPSKYKPKYCKAIEEFFDVEPWQEVEVTHTNKKGDEWTSYERRPNSMPKFHDFAKSIRVNEDTVVEWANKKDESGNQVYPEFSASYKRAKELQKWFLIENGLNGLYNATFAIFTAKNVTDMRDQTLIDHTTKGDKMPTPILANALQPNNGNSQDSQTEEENQSSARGDISEQDNINITALD